MATNDDWSSFLRGHPISKPCIDPSTSSGQSKHRTSLELSTKTLPKNDDEHAPSGRRQVMILRDADLIVAVGQELRLTSLGHIKQDAPKEYKVLVTPNVQFEVHQISVNPSGKLLAVAGVSQLAVVVLPRAGSSRIHTDSIECKSLLVGQFYHGSPSPAPIAKIEWHPWGEAGSTLMVMTVDGKLREYDISVDTDEPQQVLSFVPEKKSGSFIAEDTSEREVASFTLGKGTADWGPMTIYAIMRSGDIYSLCPYMPQNASIPSSYIHSLECFISAKQEFLSQTNSTATKKLSSLYDHQRKFVNALVKQLPPGTVFPAVSRSLLMHPPSTIRYPPARQGPFLLQPAPLTLDNSEGGDATDIIYLSFGMSDDPRQVDSSESEHLGVILIVFQDGKVDVCLDVEKVEARWEMKTTQNELPMLAVYETIDLGLVSLLTQAEDTQHQPLALDLLRGNHAVFLADPIHDDTLYVYHAFGVHALYLEPLIRSLRRALQLEGDEDGTAFEGALRSSANTAVLPLLSTYSVERRCSNPVLAVTIPNDVYLTYSIFILTSAMRITSFPLQLRSEAPPPRPSSPPPQTKQITMGSLSKSSNSTKSTTPPAYVSLLGSEPYDPPASLSRPSGLPSSPQLSIPPADAQGTKKGEFMLTPDTLRYIGTVVADFCLKTRDVQLAYKGAEMRVAVQQHELGRLTEKFKEVDGMLERLKGPRRQASEQRCKELQERQGGYLARLDRMLQSLMEKASPDLSEHEKKWFDELKRMKQEVCGSSRYDVESLVSRTRLLEREYDRLLPNLKALQEKEEARKMKRHQELGVSQAFELGERSTLERSKISGLETEVLKLAAQLEVTLGKPPHAEE